MKCLIFFVSKSHQWEIFPTKSSIFYFERDEKLNDSVVTFHLFVFFRRAEERVNTYENSRKLKEIKFSTSLIVLSQYKYI